MRVFALWNLKEYPGGIGHFFALLQRRLTNADVLHHVEKVRADQAFASLRDSLSIVYDDLNKPLTCRFCGFAIMSYSMGSGYSLHCCSTQAGKYLKRAASIQVFVDDLPELPDACLDSNALAGKRIENKGTEAEVK